MSSNSCPNRASRWLRHEPEEHGFNRADNSRAKAHTSLPQAGVKAQPQRRNCLPSCGPGRMGTTPDKLVEVATSFAATQESNSVVAAAGSTSSLRQRSYEPLALCHTSIRLRSGRRDPQACPEGNIARTRNPQVSPLRRQRTPPPVEMTVL